MKNIFQGQKISIKPKNNIIIKTKKNLISKEGPLDTQTLIFQPSSSFLISLAPHIFA
jgi:hypothetical protein